MDALQEFEKNYKAVLEKKEFPGEGLELAIAAEAAGRAAYLELARSAAFKNVSSFFNFLAGEEALHQKMLEDLGASLKSMGKWREPSPGEEKKIGEKPPEFKKLLAETDELRKNEVQGIIKSIRIEAEFRDFYAGMAGKSPGVEAKRLFSALSKFEQKHYDMLSEIYESVTSTREYTMG